MLDHHRKVEQGAALAPVLLGDRQAGPAELDELCSEAGVRGARLLHLADAAARDLAGEEVLGVAAEQLLELGRLEVHS